MNYSNYKIELCDMDDLVQLFHDDIIDYETFRLWLSRRPVEEQECF